MKELYGLSHLLFHSGAWGGCGPRRALRLPALGPGGAGTGLILPTGQAISGGLLGSFAALSFLLIPAPLLNAELGASTCRDDDVAAVIYASGARWRDGAGRLVRGGVRAGHRHQAQRALMRLHCSSVRPVAAGQESKASPEASRGGVWRFVGPRRRVSVLVRAALRAQGPPGFQRKLSR